MIRMTGMTEINWMTGVTAITWLTEMAKMTLMTKMTDEWYVWDDYND